MSFQEKNYFVFALVVPFLELFDVAQLVVTTKQFKFLCDLITHVVFDNSLEHSSLSMASEFKNLADLTVLQPKVLTMNLDIFSKLTSLNVNSYASNVVQTPNEMIWKVQGGLRYLNVSKIYCPASSLLYSFIEQFRGLTHLQLDHCMPLLTRQINTTISALPRLETLIIENCLSDRAQLHIIGQKNLKHLRLVNCSNVTGIILTNTPRLLSIILINSPIPTEVVNHVLCASPCLHELVVSRCCYVCEKLVLEHPTLQSLSLQGCTNVTELRLTCPKATTLIVEGCQSLTILSVLSHRLRSLDLRMLCNLEHVQLQCSHLCTLDLTGCSSIGIRRYRARYNEESAVIEQTPALIGSLSSALDLLGLDSSTDPADDSDHSSDSDADTTEYSAGRAPRLHHSSPVPSPGKINTSSSKTEESKETLPAVCLVEQLLLGCPSMDWADFLVCRIGGSGLFNCREQLAEVVAEFGVQLGKKDRWGAGVTPPNSPPRRKLVGSKVTQKVRKPRRAAKKN